MRLRWARQHRPRSDRCRERSAHLDLREMLTVDPALLLRAIEVYEIDRLDFGEAYLVACVESTGIGRIASFDRTIDRVSTVERVEP
jgi:predicted nucleic acid-binding protein